MIASALQFDPQIPYSTWFALAGVIVVALVLYSTRRPEQITRLRWSIGIVLQSIPAILVLVLLLNPVWVAIRQSDDGKPRLTLLIDASPSMLTPDGPNGSTRFEAAARIAKQTADQLADRYEVRVAYFDTQTTAGDITELEHKTPATPNTQTDLGAAIRAVVADDVRAGHAVLLLTDGAHNANAVTGVLESAQLAESQAAPLYPIVLGSTEQPADIVVQLFETHATAAADQPTSIRTRVHQRGFAGVQVRVALKSAGNVVDEQTITLTDSNEQIVSFEVREKTAGIHRYEVEASSAAQNEATLANNHAPFVLNVVDQPLRVMLLEGKPYWDTKFLLRGLSADPLIELLSVVRLTESRYMQRSLATADPNQLQHAPRVEQSKIVTGLGDAPLLNSLNEQQVVLLGRASEAFLSTTGIQRLREWIARDGGVVVCFRGAPMAQLTEDIARLMPVSWNPARESRFRIQLTQAGDACFDLPDNTLAQQLPQMPALTTAATIEQRSPLAITLAEARSAGNTAMPVITYAPYGLGGVVVVEGAGMWRWEFFTENQAQTDPTGSLYRQLWRGLIRWLMSRTALMPGDNFKLSAKRTAFESVQSPTLTLLVREDTTDQTPEVELTGPALAEPIRTAPTPLGQSAGAYRVAFEPLPPGNYTARLVGNETSAAAFSVYEPYREQLETASRPDLLQRVAQLSGGAVLSADNPEQLDQEFTDFIRRVRPPYTETRSAWDHPSLLLLALGCWCVAWAVRRMGGLI